MWDCVRSDFPFWTEEKLRIQNTDLNGHVNNASIAALCEAGRAEIISAVAGIPRARTLGSALRRVTIEYLAEVHYPGVVRIGSAIAKVGNTSITITQSLFEEGRCFATAESVIVFMDRTTRRPAPMPEDWRAGFSRLG